MDISKPLMLVLLHEYRLGHEAKESTQNICRTMGERVFSCDEVEYWFERFKQVNFELEDTLHPGRQPQVHLDASAKRSEYKDVQSSSTTDLMKMAAIYKLQLLLRGVRVHHMLEM